MALFRPKLAVCPLTVHAASQISAERWFAQAAAWRLASTNQWQTAAHCTQPEPRVFLVGSQKTLESLLPRANRLSGAFRTMAKPWQRGDSERYQNRS